MHRTTSEPSRVLEGDEYWDAICCDERLASDQLKTVIMGTDRPRLQRADREVREPCPHVPPPEASQPLRRRGV